MPRTTSSCEKRGIEWRRLNVFRHFYGALFRHSRKFYGRRNDLARAYCAHSFGIPVGKYTYGFEPLCKRDSTIGAIGAFCSIAGNVAYSLGNHPTDLVSTSPAFYLDEFALVNETTAFDGLRNDKIIIGHDVWIGMNATLINGVHIGTGAVIAAGAVVAKDVPPYAVVGGVPARVIRYRFDEVTIKTLLESKWWLWPDDVLRARAKDFLNCKDFAAANYN